MLQRPGSVSILFNSLSRLARVAGGSAPLGMPCGPFRRRREQERSQGRGRRRSLRARLLLRQVGLLRLRRDADEGPDRNLVLRRAPSRRRGRVKANDPPGDSNTTSPVGLLPRGGRRCATPPHCAAAPAGIDHRHGKRYRSEPQPTREAHSTAPRGRRASHDGARLGHPPAPGRLPSPRSATEAGGSQKRAAGSFGALRCRPDGQDRGAVPLSPPDAERLDEGHPEQLAIVV